MATHTDTTQQHARKFGISRENGVTDKNGRPHFFEWIKELPANQTNRKFETRRKQAGSPAHYELFTAVSGYLKGVRAEWKEIAGAREQWLYLDLHDTDGEYIIEVGRMDSRYALDLMKRLLDPAFDITLRIRLRPFDFVGKDGKRQIGVSVMNGTDAKLSAGETNTALADAPRATSAEFKGKVHWDFTPVAHWLFAKVSDVATGALPQSQTRPKSNAVPVGIAADSNDLWANIGATDPGPGDIDDLPF